MKKNNIFLICCLTFFFIISLLATAIARDKVRPRLTKVPQDFKVIAIAGGIRPGTPVSKVEINAKGEGVYWEMSAKNRAKGLYKEINRFSIEKPLIGFLYEKIEKSNFFALNKEYVEKNVLDGSFAVLTITANNKTHRVTTKNIAVKGFDEIMIAVNIITPKKNKVIYNEIIR